MVSRLFLKLLFVSIFCLSISSFAQDLGYVPGYVVTNANDTIRGLVKYANAAPYRRLQKIKFKKDEDGKVKIFPPEQNKGFVAGEKVFHSVRSQGAQYYMELVIDGPLRLYEYNETMMGVPQHGGSADMTNYYLFRKGEYEVFTVTGSFKKPIAEYLKDNQAISNKIKEGIYKRKDIREIVKEYNGGR